MAPKLKLLVVSLLFTFSAAAICIYGDMSEVILILYFLVSFVFQLFNLKVEGIHVFNKFKKSSIILGIGVSVFLLKFFHLLVHSIDI